MADDVEEGGGGGGGALDKVEEEEGGKRVRQDIHLHTFHYVSPILSELIGINFSRERGPWTGRSTTRADRGYISRLGKRDGGGSSSSSRLGERDNSNTNYPLEEARKRGGGSRSSSSRVEDRDSNNREDGERDYLGLEENVSTKRSRESSQNDSRDYLGLEEKVPWIRLRKKDGTGGDAVPWVRLKKARGVPSSSVLVNGGEEVEKVWYYV